MKAIVGLAVALASAVPLNGCAGGPYAAYDGYSYYDGYRPYAYGGPDYGYPGPYYGYPGVIGGTIYYDRRDHDRDRWSNRPHRDRQPWEGRGRDDGGRDRNDAQPPRERLDTRHGEAGNEAG